MSTNFSDDINLIVDNAKEELAERLTLAIKEEVGRLVSADKIIDRSNVSSIVSRAIYDHFNQAVANEIGNRLRCGIYNGINIDKLFDSVWTSELDKAIQDRIRGRVNKAVDDVIAERLKKIQTM